MLRLATNAFTWRPAFSETNSENPILAMIKQISYVDAIGVVNLAFVAAIETRVVTMIVKNYRCCVKHSLGAMGIIAIAYAIENNDLEQKTGESTARVVCRRAISAAAMLTLTSLVFASK